ncbi:MAG: glycine dehydrogenase (aminomethyl-transferring) [Elusimicrobia bacterium RIFCSPLOWO2_02_FULL_39_32]|nr:MAG: glycine dehydrogenase (aminomethyl-transferring) [Elusimicrobia bacterium RIFCSPHIGHO2_02_FULL_39_36]OGR91802.1 MAG: glycine dehydrogenase (aminomethyl-transferring) [Elusimicrobia bacterium RIFCSPLOWO2_02_FULL_39_32]OGR98461.1 MAG: glycine dehydrogenase (aminomethyl-transferring) [Elusimicrobia bacterium RIFCSPLOWO2_12_FULL_39_28]
MNPQEPLIFELSVRDRRALEFPACDAQSPEVEQLIPEKFLRKKLPQLPEVSEFDVVRHFTRLSQLNFSADTNFYPLGSCTMKYNPKINEKTSSLAGFTDAHPYQDESHLQGSMELLWNLEKMLCELTGMDAFSLHPAAGAQGELTGLLVAKKYFKTLGENRTKVLVPDSAHGTNPASANIAGYSIKSVPSNKRGRIDIDALKNVLDETTALVMVTCPNTLGLFEDQILEISKLAHEAGALLYMDGANFNALVGLAEPAKLGFDILHLNLHKTFSVPHGGGGPGAGPVGVIQKLSKFLPTPRILKEKDKFKIMLESESTIGQVRAFFGNTGALVRAYTYILSLGHDGLKDVSENAILNANYLLSQLKDLFPPFVPETCMHESVLSGSRYAKDGIKTLDIVKRLLDYGFYAPTIYFPLIVPEAMMIEPTETESKKSMDDFVSALKTIAQEMKDNPQTLKEAPFTTPVRRLDEVLAARNPILKWKQ